MARTGFFTRAFNNVVAARQREANRQINAILRNYSDEDLKKMGFSRSSLNTDRTNFPL